MEGLIMKTYTKKWGAFSLIVVVGIVLMSGCVSEETNIMSNYMFRIAINTNSTLENLTFIVPIPDNDTLVNMAINDSVHDSFTPQQKADGWNISIIETEYGKMFKITAKEFAPKVHKDIELNPDTDMPTGNEVSFTTGDKEVSISMVADHIIDTVNASENEPTLFQKSNKSMIYADYTSSPNASVEVFVNLEGMNQWQEGGGWNGNQYRDRLGTTFTGEKHGWFSVPREFASEGGHLPVQSPNPLS